MEKASDGEGDTLGDGLPDDRGEERDFVEMDPTGRYGRYDEVLGKGAYKTVYKAFDDLDGIEVAWNQVKIHDVLHNTGDSERLFSELHLLKTLKHKNIIKFYNSWVDTRFKSVNFITEIFISGTLRQYCKKHKHVKSKAIKHWSRQILRGLVYLHSREPPIIHRDLKCDNIFINGNNGEVKIGDLGLATILRRAPDVAQSVIGTPEFMAPELYEEHYNELVDVYSFGMCLLEMLTSEYPYSECANAAQIYKKVTMGKKPASFSKIKDPETRCFLEKCLAPVSERLHAQELLMDPFLQTDEDLDTMESTIHCNLKGLHPISEGSYFRSGQLHSRSQNVEKTSGSSFPKKEGATEPECMPSEAQYELESSSPKEGIKNSKDFKIKSRRQDDRKVLVRIRIATLEGECRVIQFEFDVEADTAMAVASEMVAELDLSDQDVSTIAEMIDTEIMTLIPDWKPGLAFDEVTDDQLVDVQQAPNLEISRIQEGREHELSTIVSLDTVMSSDISAPRNEGLVYGRFEEVGSNTTGPDYHELEPDGLGFFNDFSFGTGSDSSLNVSFDQSGLGAGGNMASHTLENRDTDAKSEPLPSIITCIENTQGHVPSLDPNDHCQDSAVSRLILQQQQELQALQYKHEQALLNLKLLHNHSLSITEDQVICNEAEAIQGTKKSCKSSDGMFEGSSQKILDPVHRDKVATDITSTSSGFDVPESVTVASSIYNTTSALSTVGNVVESVTLSGSTSIGASSGASNASTLFMSPLDGGHDLTASELDINMLEGSLGVVPPNEVVCLESSGPKDPMALNEDFKSVVVISPQTKHCVCLDYIDEGPHVSRATTERAGTESKCMPTSHEDTMTESGSLAKRESHLELYKVSNSKDRLLSSKSTEHLRTVEAVTKSSNCKDLNQEQQKKQQQVQKSIADFEAKTLENLSHSKNKYPVAPAMKNHACASLQNGQQGATVKTIAGTVVQNGQQTAAVKNHPGVPSQNGQQQGVAVKNHSIIQNGQLGVSVKGYPSSAAQNVQHGISINSHTGSQGVTVSNNHHPSTITICANARNNTIDAVQNGLQSAAAIKSQTTVLSQTVQQGSKVCKDSH